MNNINFIITILAVIIFIVIIIITSIYLTKQTNSTVKPSLLPITNITTTQIPSTPSQSIPTTQIPVNTTHTTTSLIPTTTPITTVIPINTTTPITTVIPINTTTPITTIQNTTTHVTTTTSNNQTQVSNDQTQVFYPPPKYDTESKSIKIELIVNNWKPSYGANLIITNNGKDSITYDIPIPSSELFTITYPLGEINKQKNTITLPSWKSKLSPGETYTHLIGGSIIKREPLLSDFIIYANKYSSSNSYVSPMDKNVIGLPDKYYSKYNINDIIDLNNDPNVKDIIASNTMIFERINRKKLKIIKNGSSGLKIIFNDDSKRLFGVFVNIETFLEKNNILGSVSEDDPKASIDFWSDNSDKQITNKYIPMRYIYLNGGPGGSYENGWGWRTGYSSIEYLIEPEGKRLFRFIENSQRLGIIPCFIYYNIGGSGESYTQDLAHVQDPQFMNHYYKDLKFALDLINKFSPDLPVYMIFEPDFIGYLMQNSSTNNSYILPEFIDASVSSANNYLPPNSPKFNETVQGYVQCVNYMVSKICPQVKFGWQINVWANTYNRTPDTKLPSEVLVKTTDILGTNKGLELIEKETTDIGLYYKNAGILSYGANFFTVDKYGLDFRVASKGYSESFKWNYVHWSNFLFFCKVLSITLNNIPCILWQMPVGYLNNSQKISPYTLKPFKKLRNIEGEGEDSSATFFFGGTFIPDIDSEYNFWATGTSSSGNSIVWKENISEFKNFNIIGALFGAGVGISTTGGGLARDPNVTDDYHLISSIQDYYINHYY